MLTIIIAALQVAAAAAPAVVPCRLEPPKAGAKRWVGKCDRIFGETPAITLEPSDAIHGGRWRADLNPVEIWTGTMGDADIELEVFTKGRTIIRTANGWFPVPTFHGRDTILVFEVDTAHEVQPSDLDRQIAKRANEILSTTAVWNRADDRRCPATAKTWSIYCAMERATIEVSGAAHHRRPAMEIVREIIDKRSAGRDYDHRLMGYNNDTRTTLADVQSLFREALARIDSTALQEGPAVAATGPAILPPKPANPDLELKIVDRALELLSSPAVWNRAETQRCADDARTFGIYCVLMRSVKDVTGAPDEDNAVLHDARTVVDFVANKKYGARLVNYNNDATTSFADVQAVLRILKNRAVRRAGG